MGIAAGAVVAGAAAFGAVAAWLRREVRNAVRDAVERTRDAVVEETAHDLALQSYYEGGPRMHRKNADDLMIASGRALANEVRGCFEAINEVGLGVVYFGSARFQPGSKLYEEGKALSKEVATLLKVPAWSGGGKGMMGAVTHGTREAGFPVGAVRISREASDVPGKAPPGKNPLHATTVFCQFMASRKIGLTDAGMRVKASDRTAFIALPGGIGTLDEAVEILVLGQLGKLGTNYQVPVILMNYDGYYDGVMTWIKDAEGHGALNRDEISELKVFRTNAECVTYLAEFYGVKQ